MLVDSHAQIFESESGGDANISVVIRLVGEHINYMPAIGSAFSCRFLIHIKII